MIDEIDVGDFSVGVFAIIEILIIDVVFSSVLEIIGLGTSGGEIDGKDFLEDSDFFIEVGVLVVEFFSGNSKVFLGGGELSLDGDFFRAAASDVGFVVSNESFESRDVSADLGDFALVDFDFVFKSQLVFSGGGRRADFVFLSSADLVLNGSFKVVED